MNHMHTISKLTALILVLLVLVSACGKRDEAPEEGAQAGTTEEAAEAVTGEAAEASTEEAAAAASTEESAAAASTEEAAAAGTTQAAEVLPGTGRLVAIDAGHQAQGNFDREPIGPGASETKAKVAGGTSGVSTGVPEYQLTLDISLLLRDILEERGYSVIMVRETNDVNISNSERAALANDAGADILVRIHANGSDDHSVTGAMTICQTPSNPYNGQLYAASRRLSDCVLDAYIQATGIRREYVWETDSMSGINWAQVPVTILEMGYMTNPDQDRMMQDRDFQAVMAGGVADGIDAYFAAE